MPYLIAGLGNPGTKYIKARHNIGKTILLDLAKQLNKNFSKINYYRFFKTEFDDEKIVGIIPLVYVNESGSAIKKAVHEFPSCQLIVIHDDLDITFGTIRIKKDGSSGGHNGLKSIIKSLGTNDFLRIKIGIGRPPAGKDPADFVLKNFTKVEMEEIPFIIDNAKSAIFDLIKNGLEWSMNKWHQSSN